MHFRLLDSLSLPNRPEKPNEDGHVAALEMAAVFDGATGLGENLMPGPSDAQWIANFAARRLKAHAEAGEGAPRDWLRAAAADAAKSFTALRFRAPRKQYEIPFASVMLAALDGQNLCTLWLGDCAALVRAPSGEVTVIGETLARRDYERERARRLAGGPGSTPAAPELRAKFLPALRASRDRVNTTDEWLFAPDAACADHAREADAAAAPGTLVMLASDGFLALVSDYERYTPETLIESARIGGLAALGTELRGIEAADPQGVRYPRFKASDDATALLLLVESGTA